MSGTPASTLISVYGPECGSPGRLGGERLLERQRTKRVASGWKLRDHRKLVQGRTLELSLAAGVVPFAAEQLLELPGVLHLVSLHCRRRTGQFLGRHQRGSLHQPSDYEHRQGQHATSTGRTSLWPTRCSTCQSSRTTAIWSRQTVGGWELNSIISVTSGALRGRVHQRRMRPGARGWKLRRWVQQHSELPNGQRLSATTTGPTSFLAWAAIPAKAASRF